MIEAVGAALRRTADTLARAGIADARYEARLLLAHALDLPPSTLIERDRRVETADLAPLVARRAGREPMAFILGRQGFWTLDVAVSPATLIPRADSETLIEAALHACPDRARIARVLDLGTGSGCLLLAALAEFLASEGIGVDLSPDAAFVAQANARAAGLARRASIMVGRWAGALAGRFDLVLSNPPYIATTDIPTLMPEVSRHEPRLALDGGADGLDAYRAIVADLPRLLTGHGVAVLELGAGQQAAVAGLAAAAGLGIAAIRRDLGGQPRAMVLGLAVKNHLSCRPQAATLSRGQATPDSGSP